MIAYVTPKLVSYNYRIKLKFKGSCLKQEFQAAFTPKNVIIFFIVYELDSWPRDVNTDFTLFGGVRLTKNTDPDKYWYSGFGMRFNTHGQYSLPEGSVGKNVIIFGVDMSSSVHIDNTGKDILILGKGPTQGLNHMWTAETQYSTNFKRPDIKFYWTLPFNGSNSFLFVNATKIYQFKAKTLK